MLLEKGKSEWNIEKALKRYDQWLVALNKYKVDDNADDDNDDGSNYVSLPSIMTIPMIFIITEG